MAKKILLTIDETYRNGKKAYITIGGVHRKIKKAFITKDGVYNPCYTAEVFGGYTGAYTVSTVIVDGVECDLYTLTSSGTLKLNDGAQFWMCGGGGSGGYSGEAAEAIESGGGGGGGYVATDELSSGEYVIIIGAAQGATVLGLPGATDTEELCLFNAGSGLDGGNYYSGNGGSGGGSGRGYERETEDFYGGSRGNGDGVSTIPFGISSLEKHCAGGGGGALHITDMDVETTISFDCGGDGGSNGSDAPSGSFNSQGGEYGGGGGNTESSLWCSSDDLKGGDAFFYGGGGGGAGLYFDSAYYEVLTGEGGSGYQGVCYILCPR